MAGGFEIKFRVQMEVFARSSNRWRSARLAEEASRRNQRLSDRRAESIKQLLGEVMRAELPEIPFEDGMGSGESLPIGSASYGSSSPLALGGAGDSAVMGTFAPLPLRDAVLMNGILVHGLDFEDTHPGAITHPGASAFSLALGLAAQRHATGAEMIAAYVLAIEVAARLGAAARGGFHDVGFHPTGLVGAFGCTLAAGKLMGLDRAGLEHAQGVVLSMASGSMEFLSDGAWTKRMHPGWAGVCGLTAPALAGAGFRGPSQPYEGRFGLYASHLAARGLQADLSQCTRGLGERWEVLDVAVKLYPTCHFTHASIDAALALWAAGLRAEEVASVQVLLPQGVHPVVCEPVAAKRRPANVYESQFSIHHLVALALLRGELGLTELDAANLSDPQVRALADRIAHVADPEADTRPSFRANCACARTMGANCVGVSQCTAARRVNPSRALTSRPNSCAMRCWSCHAIKRCAGATPCWRLTGSKTQPPWRAP